MSESENIVRYLADAARRRDRSDQRVGPVKPEPTRPAGRRARAGFDGAQGFANRVLGDQDEHTGGPLPLEASTTLDEQIDGALRRSQGSRRVTKLPMITSAQTAGITPEASGTLAASPPGAVRRHRPRVKVARKRRVSRRGWCWTMVAVAVSAAVLVALVIARPGHSGSSSQPISASTRSGTVAAVFDERDGSSAMTSSFLKQEARVQALAAARRELARAGIAASGAQDLAELPHRHPTHHHVSTAVTSQPEASSPSNSVPATSSTSQATTTQSTYTTPQQTYTPPSSSGSSTGSSSSSGSSAPSTTSSSSSSSGSKSGTPPCAIGALGCQ